ncbi:hypothetical protein SDC9_33972 [bioreactor metagenome]|uniref:Uncharacterized protein n=2 Tax=root TaxID=1 RepID=A0A1M7UZI6_9FIRM|nr:MULTISPECIES: hypothetical protein [Desulfitobacterium]MEA5025818.1 hypothetical protein [Desulfitobacterium hafniense]SHN88337.1 hypothetical protein SAMN02745215_05280 [Desulfitobacterium chlororespirans DSM 11544]
MDMSKKKKIIIPVAIGLGLLMAGFAYLMQIRGEFKDYLSEKYPGQTFQVGFVKIDPIYGSYFTTVSCLDDNVSFPIGKSFRTKNINESYLQTKSHNQYNAYIKEVFNESGIKSHITSVTGGGRDKEHYQNDGHYDQINLYLTEEAELIYITQAALNLLREKGIQADTVILTQEKDGHVYEWYGSTADYDLTEDQLREKIRKIK